MKLDDIPKEGKILILGTHNCYTFDKLCKHFGYDRCIGYDLHKGAGTFENFILLDFLQEENTKCSFLCDHKEWYLKFLQNKNKELNYEFINLYIKYLNEFSEEIFVKEFLKKYDKKINNYNESIYADSKL